MMTFRASGVSRDYEYSDTRRVLSLIICSNTVRSARTRHIGYDKAGLRMLASYSIMVLKFRRDRSMCGTGDDVFFFAASRFQQSCWTLVVDCYIVRSLNPTSCIR